MQAKIYSKVTNLILDQLRQGVIPWRKPWNNFYPINFLTKNPYQGINFIILTSFNFASHYFLTFNQAKKLNGHILKGSQGLPIVFWKILETDLDVNGKTKHIPFIKNSTVFNLSQTSLWAEEKAKLKELPPRPTAQKFFESLSFVPNIQHGQARAFYSPTLDYIGLPKKNHFVGIDEYYAALFHELIHSTGHKAKLNRFENPDKFNKNSHSYSFEELIAEIGSAFLCSMCGIDNTLKNSASYIKSWIPKFQDDEKLIIKASTQAKKAVNFLLNEVKENKEAA